MLSRNPLRRCSVVGAAMAQFSVCRQPWNEYIKLLSKEDSAPFHAEKGEKPAYRGYKRGREGWLFSQQVQLHYHMYPDEAVFANLTRWRHGDTVGDVGLQQFRSTQPFDLMLDDEQGFKKPEPEVYMKLNYKNPATFSRFLTRTGHEYPQDIMPLNPEAIKMIRKAKERAVVIGIYPRFGNPFWFRSQQHRPKPYKDAYDPMDRRTKSVVEQFAFNWLQNYRVKKYFRGLETMNKAKRSVSGTAESRMDAGYNFKEHRVPEVILDDKDVQFSDKNVTVPGLMSLQGLRRRSHGLYSFEAKGKRMGFNNPVRGMKKI